MILFDKLILTLEQSVHDLVTMEMFLKQSLKLTQLRQPVTIK